MPPSAFVFKTFRPGRFNNANTKKLLRSACIREGRMMAGLLQGTTTHFTGERPDFRVFTQVAPSRSGDIGVTVIPTGSKSAIDKWWRLNDGTSVRRAKMPKDFRRGTTPGRLATRPATGNKRPYVRKDHDLPGIKPRNWTRIVENRRRADFRREITKIIRDSATIKQP